MTTSFTEADLVHYLQSHPDFFERHAPLLAHIQLKSAQDGRVIGLSERQVELLRERLDQAHHNLNRLLALGRENMGLANKLHQWTRALLAHRGTEDAVAQIARSLEEIFDIPQAAVRTDAAAQALAKTLKAPVCGSMDDVRIQQTQMAIALKRPSEAASMAVVALGQRGVLLFASDDPERFNAEMDTEFLTRLGELVDAALQGGDD